MAEQDNHSETKGSEEKDKVRNLESIPLKNEKPKNTHVENADDDHDLTRELLDLYQIPFRRRKTEGY